MLKTMFRNFQNLFKPPLTLEFPAKPNPVPAHYRGLIEFSDEHCIYCDKCEVVCPPQAILFTQNSDGSKVYHYNPYLCIYCSECVRACPKPGEALWQEETLAPPALKAEDVNNRWFIIEKEAQESREAYKQAKRKKKSDSRKDSTNASNH